MAKPPALVRPAYPIEPWFSPRIWGSLDLRAFYPERAPESEPIGEAWLTADRCKVAGSPELDLATLLRNASGHLLARPQAPSDFFPILVKFLFPKDRLSVQVHPDDAYAAAHGMGRGKTEMWYVVAAAPGATLGVGLTPGASLPNFESACRAGRGAQLLHWFEVFPGDAIFLPAGSIHAIGPDLVLCEVQQQSDNTFRLDDYGRRDAHGKTRELHLEHGFAVASPGLGGRVNHGLLPGQSGLLVQCPYFRVERIILKPDEQFEFPAGELAVLANVGSPVQFIPARSADESLHLPLAHALVLPARAPAWTARGPAHLLRVTIP